LLFRIPDDREILFIVSYHFHHVPIEESQPDFHYLKTGRLQRALYAGAESLVFGEVCAIGQGISVHDFFIFFLTSMLLFYIFICFKNTHSLKMKTSLIMAHCRQKLKTI
jgi:hypothetical protein